jgi:hypothetical protein
MFSNNVTSLLKSLIKRGQLVIDHRDEVIAGTLFTQGGDVVHAEVRRLAGLPELERPRETTRAMAAEEPRTIKLVGDDELSLE